MDLPWTNATVIYELNIALPHANTKYNLSIWARSKAADKSDEYFWSQPAMIFVQTTADSMFSFLFLSQEYFELSCRHSQDLAALQRHRWVASK